MKTFRKSFIKKKPLRKASAKAQSAMEYLMTYGWAILIISVVLAALFQLGVFNPMTFAPKAPPGSCQVFRPNGPYTTQFINLEGVCSGELPQYVAQFNGNFLNNITISLPAIAPSTGSSISIALWVDPVTTSNFGGVVIGAPRQQIGWATEYAPDGAHWIYNSNYLAPGGSWTFLVAEETAGGTSAFYFNGKLIATGIYNTTIPSSTLWTFGAIYYCCGYNGKLANVQIYNTSLSANEIQALYLEGIGGAPIDLQHLVGWWPLNGNANDYSGNGNNGQISNVNFVSNWYNGYTPP